MKGLLKKSFYSWTAPLPLFVTVLFLLEGIGISFSVDPAENTLVDLIMMGMMMTTISFSLPFSMIGEDETKHWDMFLAAAPVKRRSYVMEKYIVAVLTVLLFSLVCSVSSIVLMAKTTGFDIKDYLLSLACIQSVTVIMMAAVLPLMFRFGARKGIVGFLVFFVSAFILALILTALYRNNSSVNSFIYDIVSSDHLLLALLLFAFIWGLFLVSLPLSVRAYKKRQF